jgi:hypothetical protein
LQKNSGAFTQKEGAMAGRPSNQAGMDFGKPRH